MNPTNLLISILAAGIGLALMYFVATQADVIPSDGYAAQATIGGDAH